MKKYELIAEGNIYRVKALRDFGDVKSGEIGGFIESSDNLSHEGDCWVYGEAEVFDNARVFDKARVSGNAKVSGNACVYGEAEVLGNAWVCDEAKVSGEAEVLGNAEVYESAEVSGEVCVYENARVCDEAKVGEVEEVVVKGLCIDDIGLDYLKSGKEYDLKIEGEFAIVDVDGVDFKVFSERFKFAGN